MAYKDKDKQKAAVKAATQRYRAKKDDSALSGQKQVSRNAPGLAVIPEVGDTPSVIPKSGQMPERIANVLLPTKPPIQLPDCVPKILHARYTREPDYAKVIDRLLNHTLDELKAADVWIPVWRYAAGPGTPATSVKVRL